MTHLTADWILPISASPIPHGTVTVDQGMVLEVSADRHPEALDLGRVAVLPGLVNAHTHLELSYLRGGVPAAGRMIDWVRRLLAARAGVSPDDPRIAQGIARAIVEAREAGTAVIGDVANTLATVEPLRASALEGRVFYELLGFAAGDAPGRVASARAAIEAAGTTDRGITVGLSPHAPYSVSPALFTAIRSDLDRHDAVASVHLGESPEEVEFLQRGTGPWRALLEEIGAWDPAWHPTGESPVAYLSQLDFLDARMLAVHAVQLDGEDLSRLAALGMTIVTCPRSNAHVGVGAPPIEAFYAMDVSVAFGTDSLASAPDLNLFGELAEARRLAPRVPARRLLESATRAGARALGRGDDFGTIERGRRAALIAVEVPAGTGDVEEYLVSGVQPDAVHWVEDRVPA